MWGGVRESNPLKLGHSQSSDPIELRHHIKKSYKPTKLLV